MSVREHWINVRVNPEELARIREKQKELGIRNTGAYISMHCTQPVLKSSQLVTEPSAGLEQEFFLTKQSMMLIFS